MADEKTITVKAPNASFAGEREGVTFQQGEAEATKKQARRLKEMGYRVPALDDDAAPNDDAQSDLLELGGLGEVTLGTLQDAGIDSQADLADADAEQLADETEIDAEKIAGWQEALTTDASDDEDDDQS
jgi:predicted flap endonuclease-1-like 5' DNA nuclease